MLLRSLQDPHPESRELDDAGFLDWAARLPDAEDGLVDQTAGKAVRWGEGEGWIEVVASGHEAVVQLSKLLDEAEAGEEVIIARNGTPVTRLVLMHAPKRRHGRWAGQLPALSDAEWAAVDQIVTGVFDTALK